MNLDRALALLGEHEKLIASFAAHKALLINRIRQISEGELIERGEDPAPSRGWNAATISRRELVTEIACELKVSEFSASRLIDQSQVLLEDLPETQAALVEGEISYRHAAVIIDHANSIPVPSRAEFEQKLARDAAELTVPKLDRAARVLREKMHPESIEDRTKAAIDGRTLDLQPAPDGMAWLSAKIAASDALAMYNRCLEMATSLQSPEEERTLTQLRVDVFTEILMVAGSCTDPSHAYKRVIPLGRVQVTVPVLTLLGQSEEPASLDGYGPIAPDMAREIAAHAPSFTRLLTHPETGVVLSVGRDYYKVPADLKRWLGVRDETCRFPGCNRAAMYCDLDHTVDWQYGGPTSADNLANLCPAHHNVKTYTGWQVSQATGGQLKWVSPSNRTYVTRPAKTIGFAPTDNLAAAKAVADENEKPPF
ncbi:MAG TPA: DUF222 domain-containing protein [Glaciihabitans sp.]|jgi:hypothetical protein|nr:DUF222 domain-containing protein [Glaciihabitans sp.]